MHIPKFDRSKIFTYLVYSNWSKYDRKYSNNFVFILVVITFKSQDSNAMANQENSNGYLMCKTINRHAWFILEMFTNIQFTIKPTLVIKT